MDTGVWYTIENREHNRHHLQDPMSATKMMIIHYTLNSAKYTLDKWQYRPLPMDTKK
jgi:hypothetical protein